LRKIIVATALALGVLAPTAASATDEYQVGDRWTYLVNNGVHCRVTQAVADGSGGQELFVVCSYKRYDYAGSSYVNVAPDGTITYPYWSWWHK
jgi:hypothetical protein